MKFIALAGVLMLCGCTTDEVRVARVRALEKASQQSGVYALHHVPLTRTVVYEYSHFGTTIMDPSEADYRAQRKYPCALSYIYQRKRSADFHDKTFQTYCPVCQEHYEQETSQ